MQVDSFGNRKWSHFCGRVYKNEETARVLRRKDTQEGRSGSSATGIVGTQCRRMLCEAQDGVGATRESGRANRTPEPPGFIRGEIQMMKTQAFGKKVSGVRIAFGVIVGIDAEFKWQPAFQNGFVNPLAPTPGRDFHLFMVESSLAHDCRRQSAPLRHPDGRNGNGVGVEPSLGYLSKAPLSRRHRLFLHDLDHCRRLRRSVRTRLDRHSLRGRVYGPVWSRDGCRI